ncbi:MAG: MBOAT family O-acyltransferase [Planctomycetota bacterium]
MLFVELRFLPFFALVLAVHWALRAHAWRKAWLLLASYVFYGAWDWRFLGLIIGSTVLDYAVGERIYAARGRRPRQRAWLALSLAGNLGVLGFFKYWDFFAGSAAELTAWLGMPIALPVLHVILPVGISFYTFQTLSYSLDIYRGQLAPAKTPLDLALFVAFFPQLVAGPIVLAREFLPQLEEDRRFARDVDVKRALALFFIGFVKKSCVADQVAPLADAVFAAPGAVSTGDAWVGLFAFVAQIYGDFSGYSDMAIATALLLGYQLPRNFDHPYLARTVAEFWTRWHITLGRWFRDYLYIPLGGNRGSALRTRANLLATMAVSGLWHGASWTMVVWGLFHGAVLVLERSPVLRWVTRLPLALGALYTTLVWTLSMAFFRAETLRDAVALLQRALTPHAATAGAPTSPGWAWSVLIGLALVHIATWRGRLVERWTALPAPVFAFSLGALTALALPWISLRPAPYLYFAF